MLSTEQITRHAYDEWVADSTGDKHLLGLIVRWAQWNAIEEAAALAATHQQIPLANAIRALNKDTDTERAARGQRK